LEQSAIEEHVVRDEFGVPSATVSSEQLALTSSSMVASAALVEARKSAMT